jgi:molybdopterin-guanine dinucleotide biosynthesis protein MobB
LKQVIVAVVGGKRSGKTTTIETLTRELSGKGYRIAAVKHVPEPNFTIDTERKDTWRYAQAGAKTIVCVSAAEIATIEKIESRNPSFREILQKGRDCNVIFIEGLKKMVARNKNVHKIVVVKSAEEAIKANEDYVPILAFAGPYSTEKLNLKIPYANALRKPRELAELVEELIKKTN